MCEMKLAILADRYNKRFIHADVQLCGARTDWLECPNRPKESIHQEFKDMLDNGTTVVALAALCKTGFRSDDYYTDVLYRPP